MQTPGSDLWRAAELLVTRMMDVKSSEVLLAISDLPVTEPGRLAMEEVCLARELQVNWIEAPAMRRNGDEPPQTLTSRRRLSDPVLAYTSYSLSSTAFRRYVCAHGGRFFSLPGGQAALRLLDVDVEAHALMQARGNKIKAALDSAQRVQVAWPNASLTIPLSSQGSRLDLGMCHMPGQFASPSFEVNTVPLEYEASGTAYLLAAVPDIGVFSQPVCATIQNGKLLALAGASEPSAPDDVLWSHFVSTAEPAMLQIAELGFGLNHLITFPADSYMANESVWNTIHIGIGRNLTLGGTFDAPGHIDLVLRPEQILIDDMLLDEILERSR